MPVFSRYNPRGSGRAGVSMQAHPNAEALPWTPLRTTTRTDSQWGGQGRVHRVQPHERGIFFQKTQLGSWVNGAAPAMGQGVGMAGAKPAGGCGCGGNKGVNKKA
jgi:hypothetical protein